MGVLEEVQGLKSQGMQDQQIQQSLQGQGYTTDQINEAMSNSAIKQAVSQPNNQDLNSAFPPAPGQAPAQAPQGQMPQGMGQQFPQQGQAQQGFTQGMQNPNAGMMQESQSSGEMMPSVMNAPQQGAPAPGQQMTQEYDDDQEQYQDQYDSESYQQEGQGYQAGISAETISEIADQAVSEKISTIRNKLESFSKHKTIAETQLSVLDERLKRLEKIIDRLQLSILQKVGDQMTDIADIKKELIETQKSFTAAKKTHHTPQHKTPEHQTHHPAHSKKKAVKKTKRKTKKKDDIFNF
jgi:hypothetical protein